MQCFSDLKLDALKVHPPAPAVPATGELWQQPSETALQF